MRKARYRLRLITQHKACFSSLDKSSMFCLKTNARWILRASRVKPATLADEMFPNAINVFFSTCSKAFDSMHSIGTTILRAVNPDKKFTVSVEGNIGSGKTAFLDYFTKYENIEVHQEPVNKWRDIEGHNALNLMYQDPTRWSLTFQHYVQLTMAKIHSQEQVRPVRLMERSVYSAKYIFAENLYQSGKMPDIEYVILTEWFNWLVSKEYCHIDLIVYLRTRPEVVHERVKKRCRKEEKAIPLEYLEHLNELYENWLINKTSFPVPAPVLVLDANKDLSNMCEIYEENKKQILCGYG
ncbi:thymidine kinase 2, mitochondrial isoform X1 [Lingula anatina]|uniref:Thymidine kinase 2, mitochondrial isoform X1 n=1 Tax=Lingula anatina TaxID=7574 RepID=A0A1S3K654_LINAN|nr:thymidine kinase 2, mitochondrial isoform X1 [Lingula anatina]|eukprot:XP_013417736.1 thymidine kinase 2, mitochondrial isoform X1 [Lingula anatina]